MMIGYGQPPEGAINPDITDCMEMGGRYDEQQQACMLPVQAKLGTAGWLLRAQDEPCNGWCKYDWVRAGIPALVSLVTVYGSAEGGKWWKSGLAGVGVFAAVAYALTQVERGPRQAAQPAPAEPIPAHY